MELGELEELADDIDVQSKMCENFITFLEGMVTVPEYVLGGVPASVYGVRIAHNALFYIRRPTASPGHRFES